MQFRWGSLIQISVSELEAGHERDYESSCLCHPFWESTCVIAHPTHSGASLYHIWQLSVSLSSFAHKKSYNDGKTCVLSLLMQTKKSSNFLIIASILSRTLNIVAERPCNPRYRKFMWEKNITQIGQSCEKLRIMQAVRQVKNMVSKETFNLVSQFKELCQYFAPW